jgi:type IV pili sensor histidine kinase/response regulator
MLLAIVHLAAGCATSRREPAPIPLEHAVRTEATAVIRYGRYTLVELFPDAAQQDLMQQVINLTVPAASDATVGDALRFVLSQSGYRLCNDRQEIRALEEFPLPAAHIHVGPLILRDALQILVGRAWQLEVDDGNREICFTRRSDSVSVVSPSSTSRPSRARDSRKAAS